jgi:hypothetical protein
MKFYVENKKESEDKKKKKDKEFTEIKKNELGLTEGAKVLME